MDHAARALADPHSAVLAIARQAIVLLCALALIAAGRSFPF